MRPVGMTGSFFVAAPLVRSMPRGVICRPFVVGPKTAAIKEAWPMVREKRELIHHIPVL